MRNYIALDIGGTAIKYGIYNDNYEEIFSEKVATEKEPDAFLEQVIKLVETLKNQFDVIGVAISIGGFIDPITGGNSDHTVGVNFRTFNLKKEITERLGITTEIENDANCAAIAECAIGAGVGINDICVITVGTGIGGALIVDGKLWRGAKFRSGEFGLMKINHHLAEKQEKFTSATATSVLVRRVSDALGKEVDGEYIFANLKNAQIAEIYDVWVWEIAMTAASVMVCFDPELLLVGGGVSNQEIFIEDLTQKIRSLQPYLEDIPVKACVLKNDAGKIGAVYHFKQLQMLAGE